MDEVPVYHRDMRVSIIVFFASLILLSGCVQQKKPDIIGFWYGPHPENKHAQFVFRFYSGGDSLQAHGYWLVNGHYNSEFEVDHPVFRTGEVSLAIPSWECEYTGQFTSHDNITGCFTCHGEDPDTVNLSKNDRLGDFLVYPKPYCKNPGFQYIYTVPGTIDDGLRTSSFTGSGDSLFIHHLLDELLNGKYGRYNSFLVAKDNKLICEEYFFGYQPGDLHPLESTTKSITSLLVGSALNQGKIKDVHAPLAGLLPGYPHLKTGLYNKITLYHLLTMTAGFKINEPERSMSEDRIGYALNRELLYTPGDTFQYDGGSTEILAAVLKEATGMHADAYAAEYLFKPLGISMYNWDINRQNGYPLTSGSLELTPRDMLKIGLLVLNNGMWDDKQVISEDWIHESTSAHTGTHIEGDNYGYQWWRITLASGEERYDAIWANGMGSQFIIILPEPEMVIVTTGYNYEGETAWDIFEGLKKHLYLSDK
jgi:hypothetical protein